MSDTSHWTVGTIAERIDATVIGDPDTLLAGVSMTDAIVPGTLTFAMDPKNLAIAEKSDAAAIIVGRQVGQSSKPLLQADIPKSAFARAIEIFHPRRKPAPGRHPSAVVARDALVDPSVSLGPHVTIDAGASIGPDTVLHTGVHVGEGVRIGAGCELFSHVVLYPRVSLGSNVAIHAGTVIGSPGFGYVFDESGHRPIPQVGTVEIGDNVQIGANVCIDCGTLGSTVIGSGSRIDNLVQIAHNVKIGEFTVIISQAGIAGSTTIGAFAMIGPQAGLRDHITVEPGAVVLSKAGVMNNVPAGSPQLGIPSRSKGQTLREWAALGRLPDALKRLRILEQRVDELKDRPPDP